MKRFLLTSAFVSILWLANAGQISEQQQKYIAKYEKQTLKVAPEDALLNTDQEPSLQEGFVSLYNGESLDGWTPRGGTCTFEARGDSIVGTTMPGSPSTYLSTTRDDFTDFIFTAELKWEVDGNSGIMFRAQSKPGKDEEVVFGPQAEMEGFSQDRGWSGGIYGQSAGGWLYPLWLDDHQEARQALKKGEWNRLTIKAVGKTIKTWVNGIPAAHYQTDKYFKGFFSLQVHSGNQGTIHFRNIKVKEIEKGFTNLFESGDFSAWRKTGAGPVGDGWSISPDGVIHRSGLRPGSINTIKTNYKNFDLRFEWKISKAGNSGIKYRAHDNLGLEYQILDDKLHKDNKKPSHRAASLYDLLAAPDDKPYKPAGQWNSGRILAKGNHIEHWLNGKKILEIEYGSEDWKKRFEASKYAKHEGFGSWTGSIHLQDHSDPVWYRNLRIKEL